MVGHKVKSGRKELHKYLLRLIILPVSILCAIVAITFFYLYTEDKQQNIRSHYAFLQAQLSPGFHLLGENNGPFSRAAESILAMDTHRAIMAFDNNGKILSQHGKPDSFVLAGKTPDQPTSKLNNHFYYNIPVNGETQGRIIVQTENFHGALSTHRAITGVILATALCLLVLLYFIRQFDIVLTAPLTKIQVGVRTFLNGEYRSPISVHRGSIYEDLVSLINNLAASHKTGQENYQENAEQTILDLKETLETIEIQNIELDLERKNAIQANRSKSEFLSNTSHELKTPLNSIIGFSELMGKSELTQSQSEHLRAIKDAANNLSATINDMLDYSRLEIGTLTLEHKPVNVRELIEEVVQQAAPAAAKREIRLLSIADHDVPENLLGDPLRVKQVISNLVSNAIKFTPEGYVLISISNETISDERYTLRFKITDSGIGMSSGQQDTLFKTNNPQGISENQQRATGAGLGLIISKGLVERMNGEIHVESAEGKGATFWFTATFALNLALKNHNEGRRNSFSPARAVVFERNTMSRMEIGHYLRYWGVDLVECNNEKELIQTCSTHLNDCEHSLVILDAESLKRTLPLSKTQEHIQTITNTIGAHCFIIYGIGENPLINEKNQSALIRPIKKPLLYQQLYSQLCAILDIDLLPYALPNESLLNETLALDITVLAVDDNPANLRLVSELLKDKNIEVDTANSGLEAIEKFQTTRYDLIFMDVQMPDLDGMQTTQKLRAIEKRELRTPIIALTAHAANEKKMDLLIAGMDDYLSKPLNGNDLQHILDRWATRRDASSPIETPSNKAALTTAEKSQVFEQEKETIRAPQDKPSSALAPPVDVQLSLEKAHNKTRLAADMLQMLLDSLKSTKRELQTLEELNKPAALQEEVHKLLGGSCYCGVPALTDICKKIDDKLLKKNSDDISQDLRELYQRIDELIEWSKGIDVQQLFQTK